MIEKERKSNEMWKDIQVLFFDWLKPLRNDIV